jgi:hypothetical protein
MGSLGGIKTFSVDGVFYPITSDTTSSIANTVLEAVVAADGQVHSRDNPKEATISVNILCLSDTDLATLAAVTDGHAVLDYGNGTADEIEHGFVNLGDRGGDGQIACVVTGKGKRS